MAASDGIEAHYERLLFRARAEKAVLETKLEACEDLIRSLANGSLSWIHADRAAEAVVQMLDTTPNAPARTRRTLSEALADALTKDISERDAKDRDNREPCTEQDTDWECGGCGLFLGSQPSPDFGNYPCVCGRRNRPVPVHPNSHNHRSRRKP